MKKKQQKKPKTKQNHQLFNVKITLFLLSSDQNLSKINNHLYMY